MPVNDAQFTHDAFISYSHKDRLWVDGVLVKTLRDNKLTVLTDDDFDAGVSAVVNMSNAVKSCRRTVVVLTPDWLESEWTAYEGVLTTYIDPSGSKQRMIPIMRRPCEPPAWIGFRTRIDLVDDAQLESQLTRLVRTLAAQPVEVVKVDLVNAGLRTMAELLRGGPVRDALLEFRFRFGAALEHIARLAVFKDVHDQLHHLQFHCYDQILREAAALAGGDASATDNLAAHADTLQAIINRLRDLEKESAFDGRPLAWLAKLDRAGELLAAAIAGADAALARKAAAQIERVLAVEPPAVDALLNQAARDLELRAIIAIVDVACRRAGESKMEPARLAELQEGLDALESLDDNLNALVNDHGRWQTADVELRRVDTNLAGDAAELIDSWPDLKVQFAALVTTDEAWARSLRAEGVSLDSAIGENDLARMTRHFRSFRRQAVNRFFEIDLRLKRQCDELRKAGEPLAAIVKVLA